MTEECMPCVHKSVNVPHRAWGLASIALLLFAGCGEGDRETITEPLPAPALTKPEFIVEADRICRSGDSQIEAVGDDLYFDAPRGQRPKPAEVRRFALNIVVPRIESEIAAIEALGAPPGDEAEVEAILDATAAGVREIRADPEGLADGPPDGLRRAGDLAGRYGSRECGVE